MGDFNLQTTLRSGPISLDADAKIDKRQRLKLTSGAAICLGERVGMEGTGALAPAAHSDPANALFWRHDPAKNAPRGGWGSWSFAMPGVMENIPGSDGYALYPYGAAGAIDEDFIPLTEAENVGEDFDRHGVLRRGYGADKSLFPIGTEFLITSTTGHGTHTKMAAPIGGPLVASHWDRPEYSRHVFEVRHNKLAEHGPLHSHLRVIDSPALEGFDGHIPAWNLGAIHGVTGGRGAFVAQSYDSPGANMLPADFAFPAVGLVRGIEKSIGAYASVLADGPFHTGGANDKHRRGVAADGTPWNAGHLSTGALWYCDELRDGPQEFTRKIYPQNARDGGWFQTPVEQQFDPTFQYATPTGQRHNGAWRWVARSPIYTPDPPVELARAVKQTININIVNNIQLNVNWAFWWLNVNIVINPGNGDPIDIARLPLETGFPSIHGTAIRRRDQPYDGRFGAPSTGGNIRGVDPANPPPGFSTGGRDQIEGSDQTNYSGSGEGSVDRIWGGPDLEEPPTTSGTTGQPTGYTINQEYRDLIQGEPLLSNPDARPWSLSSPVVWSMHSIGAVNSSGEADATFKRGDFFKHAPTTDGLAWFTPPEIVPDAEAAPRTTSAVTLALYNGLWPSSAAACGEAAKLGFLTPSQETGAGSDGFYLTATGSTGAINGELKFVDASGAARNGDVALYGQIRGANTGANVGLGSTSTTAATDAGTDLVTVGTDSQVRRYTFAAKTGGYTYNIDLDDAAPAGNGSTFAFDLEIAVDAAPGDTITVNFRNGSGGSTLKAVASALSGAVKRAALAHFDGTDWRIVWLVANLT